MNEAPTGRQSLSPRWGLSCGVMRTWGLRPRLFSTAPSGLKPGIFTRMRSMTDSPLHALTRRHFFRDCSVGVGKIALASLLAEGAARAATPTPVAHAPGSPVGPHFPAKAKRVIY